MIRVRTSGAFLLFFLFTSSMYGGASWWNTAWKFRVPVDVLAGPVDRIRRPAEIPINFTTLTGVLGTPGVFDPGTIRVVEVNDVGAVVRDSVPFQFDPAANYHPGTNASGTLIILLEGLTPANSYRSYNIYFDFTGTGISPAPVPPQVTVTDNIPDEGQDCFRVTTPSGTIYYQKIGAGFSSWLDKNGNDWVSYNPTPNSIAAGSSRGIPNSAYPRGFFHPGSEGAAASVSTLLSQGPLRASIRSVQVDGYFECRWDIYPEYARLTMVHTDSAYWILYEGTPGGELEPSVDFVVRSDGRQTPASDMWVEDIPTEEWVYFADPNVDRSLYLFHEEDDQIIDQYYAMETVGPPLDGKMTVFGFGRQSHYMYLYDTPQHFVYGLVDGTTYAPTAAMIRSSGGDVASSIGAPEQQSVPQAALLLPPDGAVNQSRSPRLVWGQSPQAQRYRVQVARDSSFGASTVAMDSTTADTTLIVPSLQTNTLYYWRVAVGTQTVMFPFGPAHRFSTIAGVPNQVKLVSPLEGATVRSDSIRCTWNAVPGADRYDIEWNGDPFFAFPEADSIVTDTSKTLSLPEGQYYWRVRGGNVGGWGPYSAIRSFTSSLTAVLPTGVGALEFRLLQNYPNPFNPSTQIGFSLAAAGRVRLTVYNTLGQTVEVLLDDRRDAGWHSIAFEPLRGVPSGIYFYRLTSGDRVETRRMLYLR